VLRVFVPPLQVVVEGGEVVAEVAVAVATGREAEAMAVAMVAEEDTTTTTVAAGTAVDVATMAEVAEVDVIITGITIMVGMATGTMPIRMRVTKGRSTRQMPIGMALRMEIIRPTTPVMANLRDLTTLRAVATAIRVAKLVTLLAGVRTQEVRPN